MPGLGSGQLVCRFGFLSTHTKKMPALQLPRMPVASDSACIKIGDCTVRASPSVTVPCYTSFLASTDALPSISIKDTIVFGQLHEIFDLRVKFGETRFSMESCSVTCQLSRAEIWDHSDVY